ncbi:CAP domain-containing protein [Streptomyces smyrnaeus]|uniref:CAP domain-containing protein n=1 Tax=Streptomyces TaxID=1883 RepID=UPI0016146153|nr:MULTISPECIES: CAP domain-containing protein [unclassified Streptomyces]MBQ0865369.1 CAP domain-containing protein [Streptomyces sp. RK75]MBQ1120380.1 CAP domain-containing protein [Streptomyces sp. B15]MBQ1161633.1 CAP domain-containing protein [Streptomyces sp. A73]
MGRHRRANPTPAAAPEPFERQSGPRHHASRHRRRAATPVRTGLLGASAALAMGTVAVASGLIPAPGGLGGPRDGRVQADGTGDPASPPISATPSDRTSTTAPEEGRKGGDPRATPSQQTSRPEKKPRTTPSEQPSRTPEASQDDKRGSRSGDDRRPEPDRAGGGGTAAGAQESAAESEVLALVNQERAKAGCRPLKADDRLATLAGNYSEDMARRGFFSHTSPDGKSPWDRAEAAGIDDLGGENIARGQANARSVMDSWMRSPGHRANILNCDYRTLGVGAHFAEGGPWWTQNFGF